MNQEEYSKILPTLPKDEQGLFSKWYASEQDAISWDQFLKRWYAGAAETQKSVERHIQTFSEGRPQQLYLSFMPNRMARTSPFFLLSRREMANTVIFDNFVVENTWGRLTLSGPRLSVSPDETNLLALCALAKNHNSSGFATSYSELCDVTCTKRGGTQYKTISQSLDRLRMSSTMIELFDVKDPTKQKVSRSISGAIVVHLDQNYDEHAIGVELNPYFLALYGEGLTTGLNIEDRAKLKGDTTKALYRFVQTHKPDKIPFHLSTLCLGINMNTAVPLFKLRYQIRQALAELRKHKHIKSWHIDSKDNVYITR